MKNYIVHATLTKAPVYSKKNIEICRLFPSGEYIILAVEDDQHALDLFLAATNAKDGDYQLYVKPLRPDDVYRCCNLSNTFHPFLQFTLAGDVYTGIQAANAAAVQRAKDVYLVDPEAPPGLHLFRISYIDRPELERFVTARTWVEALRLWQAFHKQQGAYLGEDDSKIDIQSIPPIGTTPSIFQPDPNDGPRRAW